jgi:uncharacterized protein YozE (UPF0346 family)
MTNLKSSIDDVMKVKGLTKFKNPKHLDDFHKNMRYILGNADTFFESSPKKEEYEKLLMGRSVRDFIFQARNNFKIICTFCEIPTNEFLMMKESFTGFQRLIDAEINYQCNIRNHGF